MGVDDVEGVVGEVQRVYVADREVGVCRAAALGAAERQRLLVASTAVTRPGATRSARSAVIVPGPQPTSSSRWPGVRCGSR